MRCVGRISPRYAILNANTSRSTYIDPLSPPWRHTAVDAADCNRRVQPPPFPVSPRPVLAPRYGIRDSWLLFTGRGAGRGSAGLVPARLNRRSTNRLSIPSRRRAGASSSRASERSPVLGGATSRRVQNAKASRAGHRARVRSLARSRRP